MTAKLIDLNEGFPKGYVLFVLYAPGHYAPCPSIFLSDIEAGRCAPVAMHFTALYEAVDYIWEMKRRKLIGDDSKLFIRNDEGIIVWRNDEMKASAARYLENLKAADAEECAA